MRTLTTSILTALLLAACTVAAPEVELDFRRAECEAQVDQLAWALDGWCVTDGASGPYCACRAEGELLDALSCLCLGELPEDRELELCLEDADYEVDVGAWEEDAELVDLMCSP